MKELIDLPLVQLGDKASLRVGSVEDADKVCKNGFPDTQLKLVKEIHNSDRSPDLLVTQFSTQYPLKVFIQYGKQFSSTWEICY